MRRRYVLTLLAFTGCTHGAAAPDVAPGADPCIIMPAGAEDGRDTVRIALELPVDPIVSVARAHHPALATFAAAMYETLVETDCRGVVRPGLASHWSADSSGARWTFVLRPDAMFADGSPATARDVVGAWTDPRLRRGRPMDGARARVQNVEIDGPDGLTVQLDRRADASLFADPSLAIRRYAEPWPAGTGPYEVVADDTEERIRGTVRLRRVSMDSTAERDLPLELHFAVPPSADLRNALDLGADVVLTRDAAVVEYARAIGDYTMTPLPWDVTYVLLAPAAVSATPVPESALGELARDAVPGEARPAAPLAADVTVPSPAVEEPASSARLRPGSGQPSNRIVYRHGDAAARGLAERIVALATARDAHPWLSARLPAGRAFTAQPLDPRAFNESLRDGRAAAYIVGVSKDDIVSGVRRFDAVPWLHVSSVRDGVITPLVDTRPMAVHTPSLGPVRIDAAGTLRFGLAPGRRQR